MIEVKCGGPPHHPPDQADLVASASAWYRTTSRGYNPRLEPRPHHWDDRLQMLAPASGGSPEATETTLAILDHGPSHLMVPLEPEALRDTRLPTPEPSHAETTQLSRQAQAFVAAASGPTGEAVQQNFWENYRPTTLQPPAAAKPPLAAYRADVRVSKVVEEIAWREKVVLAHPDEYGGEQAQKVKLAAPPASRPL